MKVNQELADKVLAASEHAARFVREPHIARTVVFTNGLPGCGKTMIAPIVGSLAGVELMRFNFHLEHVCVLRYLDGIQEDGAISLIRLQTDLDLYDSLMSRETNFRFSDLSSVWKNSQRWRYFKRLFMPGDEAVIPRIEKENPILHLVTHLLLGISQPLFQALGRRARIVEVVRHPLYMLKQSYTWMPRSGVDPRIFGLWIDYRGHSLPWFAHGWEDLYLRSNRMDRTIYVLEKQWCLSMEALKNLPDAEREQVLLIPFEQFVLDPEPFMRKLERLLESRITAATRRMMKKQNIPRRMIADGIGLKIYKYYGWEPSGRGSSERDELAKRRAFAAAEATPEAMRALDRYCEEYEASYFPDDIA